VPLCPTCDRERPEFVIKDDKCDWCRAEDARETYRPHEFDMSDLRAERDRRLTATDWTQLTDVPEPTRNRWRPYRQALRDLPANVPDLAQVKWPQPPE
jgi:hypothetical protein